MLWTHREDTAQARQRDLSRRLRKLERLFPVHDILAERLDAPRVQAYYRECHAAYRKHHSSEGAAHMALNPSGRYDPDGFREHLRRIEARWTPAAPRDVLEIGFGQGFNLGYLVPRHPGVQFHGIDLTPDHAELARARLAGQPNVALALGDMHALPLKDASIDEVFAIEAFCYAQDLPRALGEVARVLRPGGRFTLFDGYQPKPTAQLDADGAMAVELVARGTALERWQVPAELIAEAGHHGLALEKVDVLDREVLPNLKRLDTLVGAIIRLPWLARRALARRAPARSRNVLSGYLLYPTVAMGLLGYQEIVLRKAAR
ncbi:MAG: class I SAM-dependent methyltransferase [Rubrivivax sp.]|nr:class I SAM-dependent methyltransferase [Rubrivivax sp.]